jgi:hypothetical protein
MIFTGTVSSRAVFSGGGKADRLVFSAFFFPSISLFKVETYSLL